MRIIPPYTAASDEGYVFLWGHNPDSIDRGTGIIFFVEGGVAPYSWVLTTGTSFSILDVSTNEQYNRIYALNAATSGDEDEVTVTDAEGNDVTGFIKCCSPTPCCNDNDTDVVLLLNSDNANGNQVFTDTGLGTNCPHTISIGAGSPIHSTTKKKIGSSSLYFDGNSWLTTPDHADWDFGTNDFCVDAWINSVACGGYTELFGRYNAFFASWVVGCFNGVPYFYSNSFGAARLATTSVIDGLWHHYAAVRIGDIFSIFIDGLVEFTGSGYGSLAIASAEDLTIGWTGRNNKFTGYLDQIRVSNGNGRFPEEFIPSTSIYLLNTPGYAFSWDQGNIYGLVNQWLALSVSGGCPPYLWSVDNDDFEFLAPWTNGLTNRIRCTEGGAVGTVTVTDACGSVVGEASVGGVFSSDTSDIIIVSSFDTTEEDWWGEEDIETFCGGGSYEALANTGDTYGPFAAGEYVKVEWTGGVPPYDMQIYGDNFFLDVTRSQTTGRTGDPEQVIFSNVNACGTVRLHITDACGNALSVLARTNEGHWVWVGLCQEGGGCVGPTQQGPYEYGGMQWYGFCCGYDTGFSHECCWGFGDGTELCWSYSPGAPCDPDGVDSMNIWNWGCT